jgi:hypothetical protein
VGGLGGGPARGGRGGGGAGSAFVIVRETEDIFCVKIE